MKTLIEKKQAKLKVFTRQGGTTLSRIVSIKLIQKDTTNEV